VPIILKSGSLNFLEPSGPVKACNWIALHLPHNVYFVFALSLYEPVRLHKLVSMRAITKLTKSTLNYVYIITTGGVQRVREKAGSPGEQKGAMKHHSKTRHIQI
jgi:hypothetical protein